MTKHQKNILASTLLLIVFLLYTYLVVTVDARAVGPQNSIVGFSTINVAIHRLFGEHEGIYRISEILGYLALLTVPCFALCGLLQWIKRKSFLKVDREILLLGAFYLVVLLSYAVFEKVIVNYRPLLLDGEPEASYPSSHTVMALCVMESALPQLKRLFGPHSPVTRYSPFVCHTLMILIEATRLFSGVHWLTDILGGVLLAVALLSFYRSGLEWLEDQPRKK